MEQTTEQFAEALVAACCPHCKADVKLARLIGVRLPKEAPGICHHCAGFCVIQDGTTIRAMTDDELAILKASEAWEMFGPIEQAIRHYMNNKPN
jgi:hypothetical protein